MSTAAIPATTRWATLAKRFGLAAIFVVLLLYLIPHDGGQSVRQSHPSLNIHEGEEGLRMPTNVPPGAQETDGVKYVQSGFDERIKEFSGSIANADWGLMGRQVKKLTDWAVDLNGDTRTDPKHLNDALLTRFPFLKASKVYKPWSYVDDANKEVLAKTALVMCVGSRNFHMAAHLLVSLRQVLNAEVAIEIAYAGDNDLRPQHRDFLGKLGDDITFIDLLETFPAARDDLENSGWAMKPFSILASKHARVILVDADALFLVDPSKLFDEDPDLNRTGTLLYHDRAALGGGDEGLNYVKAQIAAAGIEPSRRLTEQSLYYSRESWYEADSGLVAVDKSRPDVFMSIVFVSWMNTKAVRDEVTYKYFYGDKETFWIAMELCGLEYYFEPLYAGSMGHITGEYPSDPDNQETQLCSTHMLHMDHGGDTPFWVNGGIYQHKDKPDLGFADISHYWRGNLDGSTKAEWWWEDGNIACLKKKGIKAVPADMLLDLQKMYQKAANIDDEIRRLGN